MGTLSAKNILNDYKTGEKETAMEGILFDLIPDADKRKSVIQALRLEMTRKTTRIPPKKEELEIFLEILKKRGYRVIDLLQNNTCIEKREDKENVALAIVDYVQKLAEDALRA